MLSWYARPPPVRRCAQMRPRRRPCFCGLAGVGGGWGGWDERWCSGGSGSRWAGGQARPPLPPCPFHAHAPAALAALKISVMKSVCLALRAISLEARADSLASTACRRRVEGTGSRPPSPTPLPPSPHRPSPHHPFPPHRTTVWWPAGQAFAMLPPAGPPGAHSRRGWPPSRRPAAGGTVVG